MNAHTYVIFSLDDRFYAISVTSVKHIIRSVQPTFLSDAPELLFGLINMSGKIIPVINIRKQLQLPKKNILLTDRMIIARTSFYTIAFLTDAVIGVRQLSAQIQKPSDDIFPDIKKYIKGVSKFNNLTIIIYDIDTLFPSEKIQAITQDLNKYKEIA